MPIITVQFIQDVVATPEQKRELIVRLTDTFCDILGDVVRPFVYCIIQETPQQEWGIAGVPMPDLVYLTSDQHAQVIDRSNELMRGAIAQMQAAGGSNNSGTAAEHRKLFTRWFEELWNKKNYSVAYELVDPDFTAHGAGGQDIKQGPDGVVGMVKAWHAAMPDGRMTIDDIITEGNLSTIRMTWTATHTGKFGDIPASNKRITVTSIGIDRVIDGKITEGWGELNMLGMLQQMGAIPTPDAQPQAASNNSNQAHKQEGKHAARNRDIIHRFYEAVNSKQREVFYEIVHPDFVNHGGAAGDIVGPQALIDSLNPFYEAMPDWHVSEDFVVAQGDRVASRGTITGTHKGSFMGVPPTGKKVSWTGIIIYRLDEDGMIIERWQDFDRIGMLQQMGVIPAMG
jgi:steroid delta-isomerase-like uncharacterized protein/4-oxalocrotonate tautomerase family enzyme